MQNYRKLGLSDLEVLKLVLIESVFEGLKEADNPGDRARFVKLGLDLVKDSGVDWLTDVISHLETKSPTINADAVTVNLQGFDLTKYLQEGAKPKHTKKEPKAPLPDKPLFEPKVEE